jgi:MoxR-like ATPase
VTPVATRRAVAELSRVAGAVHVDRAIVRYVRELAEASREQQHVRMGLSARGCLAFVRVAKTWAAADGRTTVVPSDITALATPVLCHRLLLDPQAQFNGVSVDDVIERLLDSVEPPTYRG